MTITSTGPLAGVKILDLSTVVLGPYATQLMGDMGADVIKVENGAGDIMRHAGPSPAPGMGAIYMGCNRNKRAILLDLKNPEGLEALRRLEIPEDMARKHGFAPLGPADGPVKNAIFGGNSAKMYRYDVKRAGLETDRFAAAKADYLREGAEPSHLRYGYVVPG